MIEAFGRSRVFHRESVVALAYFITFTTYGMWLHGTEKGKGSVDREHNGFGEEFVAADARRERVMREGMTQAAYVLDEGRRRVVCDAVVGMCREKGWRLYAVHVRTNHVHVVVGAEREPERVMSDLKGRASRELTAAGYEDAERKRWTRHGSTPRLFDEADVAGAVAYVLDRQGERMAWFEGREAGAG